MSRSKNQRSTLRAFRDMAAEGYPSDRGARGTTPHVFKPRARWRRVVELIARENGWRFIDAFLFDCYRDFPPLLGLERPPCRLVEPASNG